MFVCDIYICIIRISTMNKIRLTESDIKYMIRKAINEVMAYEGDEATSSAHDKYYFDCGWDKSNDGRNPFTAEGPVGENFDEFVEQLKEYVDNKMQEYEKRKGRAQGAMDAFLKKAQERHGKFAKSIQRKHEMTVRGDNDRRSTSYPEFLKPGGNDYSLYDTYLKNVESEEENNKRWLAHELKIAIEMPTGAENKGSILGDYGWKRYAQISPKTTMVSIDPENIEASAEKAWSIFANYAEQTPEVIGWFVWQWSTFPITLRPILTPEVGEVIMGETDNIQKFYDSLRYKGD